MKLSNPLSAIQELLLGLILCLGVWPFGAVHAPFEKWLSLAIALSVIVWFARLIVSPELAKQFWESSWRPLAALVGVAALVALPILNLPLTQSKARAELIASAQSNQREATICTGEPINRAPQWVATASSLQPVGNYRLALHLGLIAGLIAVAASFERPVETLRRMAIAGALTGTLLAIFSMGQGVAGSSRKIYWFFEGGGGYGPFINKNHYPFMANCLLGLTLGLFYERQDRPSFTWRGILNDPISLGFVACVALQVASMMLSLSRGGVVACATAVSIVSGLRFSVKRTANKGTTIGMYIAIVLAVLVLFYWVGFDLMESRLTSISQSDAYLQDSRWYLWHAALTTWLKFPLYGSGGETFRYWETMYTEGGRGWNATRALRADNEFIDIAAEYGLLSALLVVIFVLTWLPRMLAEARRSSLIAGVLVGLIAVTLHSFGDFGLRVPATAAVASIILGLILSAAQPETSSRSGAKAWLGFGAAIGLVALGWLGYTAALQASQADVWRRQAWTMLKNRQTDGLDHAIAQAVTSAPVDAEFYIEMARLAFMAQRIASAPEQQRAWNCRGLSLAVQARDICPLVWEPQVWLYTNHSLLATGESPEFYIRNAHRLHPSEGQIAFTLGSMRFDQGQVEEAIAIWHDSLQLSTDKLKPILDKAVKTDSSLDATAALARLDALLPADAEVLWQASRLLNDPRQTEHLLSRAAALASDWIGGLPQFKQPQAHATMARICSELEQFDKSVSEFRVALRMNPNDVSIRREYAQTLLRAKRLNEARNEVRILEHLQGANPPLDQLKRAIEASAIK